MKGKILNKARLAGAVMLATAGVAAGTAQADSLLAPLVIYDTTGGNAGTNTYFAMKLRGSGIPDQFNLDGGVLNDTLHYYYIQKTTGMGAGANTGVTSIQDLHTYAGTGGCHVQNNSGRVSSWDVVFQSATGGNYIGDNSAPNGWDVAAGDFYGMMVMDDQSNLPEINGDGTLASRRIDEGEFSGFAYIVNTNIGMMLDYKLINNHLSKQSGDFSPGYISKQSIDWMWLPASNTRTPNPIGAGFQERTAWYTAVTGKGMSRAAENTPGSRWDEVVTFTQQPTAGKQDIQTEITAKSSVSGSGAYNNDEDVVSGDKDLTIKCLGLYDRSDFLTSLQIPATNNGGWKPVHVVATSNSGLDTVAGRGALTYRFDDVNGFFNSGIPDIGITMQVETGGNRNAGGFGSHPNRAY